MVDSNNVQISPVLFYQNHTVNVASEGENSHIPLKRAFVGSIFMKVTNTQHFFVDISYAKFYPNLMKYIGYMGKI